MTDTDELFRRQKAHGYTDEELTKQLKPMVTEGQDPVGSMGYDAPLAVLSEQPQLLYNYFKQLFAQVTNPPIDVIRERTVTSTVTALGAERNLLCPEPISCRRIRLDSPLIDGLTWRKLRDIGHDAFRVKRLSAVFPVAQGSRDFPRTRWRGSGSLNSAFRKT